MNKIQRLIYVNHTERTRWYQRHPKRAPGKGLCCPSEPLPHLSSRLSLLPGQRFLFSGKTDSPSPPRANDTRTSNLPHHPLSSLERKGATFSNRIPRRCVFLLDSWFSPLISMLNGFLVFFAKLHHLLLNHRDHVGESVNVV